MEPLALHAAGKIQSTTVKVWSRLRKQPVKKSGGRREITCLSDAGPASERRRL